MSQWDNLSPGDFMPTKDQASKPLLSDHEANIRYRPPPPLQSSLSLSQLPPRGMRRQREEPSPTDEDYGRRLRPNPAESQGEIHHRHEHPKLIRHHSDRPARPGSASSSRTSSTSSRHSHSNIAPQPLSKAQSLQMVTRALPPISSFDDPARPITTIAAPDTMSSTLGYRDTPISGPAPVAQNRPITSCPAYTYWAYDLKPPVRPSEPNMSSRRVKATPVPTISITGHTLGILPGPDVSPPGGQCPTYLLRADMKYDPNTNTMTTVMEVPGIRKADFKLMLMTCPYTGQRLLRITGKNQPGGGTWTFQERKYGDFGRNLIVPAGTKRDNVCLDLSNGILTVTVPCLPPGEPEEPIELTIP